ncbi:hypothetical protein BRADI_1g11101v3 [Brachypodium distachyon]|uniref:Uncharacterized protein n=1 Tax=Brachypodium distachyon TaxID=15368 RepID=A0A2K2DIZ9_BRADI|nr:hypothetical protein BRADI_1g11101v3 [Brachypodium distachyon]
MFSAVVLGTPANNLPRCAVSFERRVGRGEKKGRKGPRWWLCPMGGQDLNRSGNDPYCSSTPTSSALSGCHCSPPSLRQSQHSPAVKVPVPED